ncbi:MAG: tetratricopeptide repeat protein [Drouetiella hepatica Uher 2000/2452]|uniref:Tetratricopeptide repeat protein n=1 Tax=Drouetiella hepatica Uher 2000/2452 TaxID=904376 RepID=A0A951QER8_9CYAN|nr:tetratricopeptide repeat protein [Drouetiella hepatica Uher 2000/2452]
MVAPGEIDWDTDVVADLAESYESLVRSLQRTEGFSLFFVRCVPGDQADLVQLLQADLPNLHMQRLELTEELVDGNLYQRVTTLPDVAEIDVLFISGLEKSFDPYVKSGYGGQGDYYKRDTVPRVLGHLNLQRERFRDDFPFCFVFFLSAFGIKYIARRAPDFFDWRSGIFEFIPDAETVRKLTQELYGDYREYLTWSHSQRMDCIRDIQGILEEDQQTPDQQASLWWEKGNILAADQNYEAAIASYDRAVEVKLDYHEAWYNRGILLDNLGRYEEAITSYDKAVEIKPDKHKAWNNRGISLNNLGRYEEAIASYDKAVEIKPDYHEAWYNRGISLDDLGRYEEAIASYDKAVEVKPDYHEAWYNRGILLNDLGHYGEAIASYDKAVEIKPDKHEAWNNRGISLKNLGRYEEAIASYDKAVEVKPDYHEAWNNRGISLKNLGRYEEAIASYDKAVEVKPDKHEAWNNRGSSLANLGRYEEAIASYEKALEFKPDYYRAWDNRGDVLKDLERYEEAIASYDRAIEINPEYQFPWESRGFALMQLMQFEAAHESFDRAIFLKPDDATAHYNKACCYGLQKNIDLAIETLQYAITLDSENRELAKTDSDFDGIRESDRFRELIDD